MGLCVRAGCDPNVAAAVDAAGKHTGDAATEAAASREQRARTLNHAAGKADQDYIASVKAFMLKHRHTSAAAAILIAQLGAKQRCPMTGAMKQRGVKLGDLLTAKDGFRVISGITGGKGTRVWIEPREQKKEASLISEMESFLRSADRPYRVADFFNHLFKANPALKASMPTNLTAMQFLRKHADRFHLEDLEHGQADITLIPARGRIGGPTHASPVRKLSSQRTSASSPTETKEAKLVSAMAGFLSRATRTYTVSELVNDYFKLRPAERTSMGGAKATDFLAQHGSRVFQLSEPDGHGQVQVSLLQAEAARAADPSTPTASTTSAAKGEVGTTAAQNEAIKELCRMVQAAGGSLASHALGELYRKLPSAKGAIKDAGKLQGLCALSGGRLSFVAGSGPGSGDFITARAGAGPVTNQKASPVPAEKPTGASSAAGPTTPSGPTFSRQSQTPPSSSASPQKPARQRAEWHSGVVKKVVTNHDFGFISVSDGEDVWFHFDR
eukprot:COSAG01_NODE_12355_length_1754_cov_1.145619_1_plen_498_part_10